MLKYSQSPMKRQMKFEGKNEVAILDFGSQYTHLIARRIRELGVVSHIYPNDVPAPELKHAIGIILSGGPRSVVRDAVLPFDKKLFDLGVPILGLCYGHQLMAKLFGGSVGSGAAREYGLAKIKHEKHPLFKNVKQNSVVWMSHGDHVEKLPNDFVQLASSGTESIAAMGNDKKKQYAFQFHPEVAHSQEGKKILSNFLFGICKAKKNWTSKQMLDNLKKEIKQQAGNKHVFLLVSGGVDSAVCFALLEKALGKKRVYGFHVDTGLMRWKETDGIKKALAKAGFTGLQIYNAEQEYLEALKGVTEPEKKRKIIGDLFLDITDRIMAEKNFDPDQWLIGQGTIYPDTIESGGTKNADVIKTHHNRVPRIKQMIAEGKIIEPIRELYKDEVREIGHMLGLPKSLVQRHPFPGPGLGIRVLCSEGSDEKSVMIAQDLWKLPVRSVGVQGDERSYSHPALLTSKTSWTTLAKTAPVLTNKHREINRVLYLVHGDKKKLVQSKVKSAYIDKQRLELLQKIDYIVQQEISKLKNVWQFPVVLVPFGHEHGESIVLRPVESEEAMTVSFAQLPDVILKKIIKKIASQKAIDFIFYDVTNKPPGTIEWE